MLVLGRSPWSRALTAAACALAVAAGCSNPKCWTHDSSEVPGGCSLWGGDGDTEWGGDDFNQESYVENLERQITEYKPLCDAGDAIACWMVGTASRSLDRPVAQIEAAFGRACRGGLTQAPGDVIGVCDSAGDAALRRGGSGERTALAYYVLGCERGSSNACSSMIRLQPAPGLALATIACRLGSVAACTRAAALVAADPEQSVRFAFRGCELGDATMCQAMGRIEVAR